MKDFSMRNILIANLLQEFYIYFIFEEYFLAILIMITFSNSN